MTVSIIVAASESGVIGRGGELPWRLREDLRRFRRLTLDRSIIMGRRTWESIGRPLPRRRSIVLTRRPGGLPAADRPETAPSLEVALAACAGEDEVFVIGGEAVFREALALADRIYLTVVLADVEGDVHFPLDALAGGWRRSTFENVPADAENEYPTRFEIWERTTASS